MAVGGNGYGHRGAAAAAALALAGLVSMAPGAGAQTQTQTQTGAAAAAAPLSGRTYGQGLVARTLARYPGVRDIHLRVGAAGPPGSSMGANTLARPLTDSMGAPIGSVEVAFASAQALSAPLADAVARELGRHIYLPSNLTDPEPFVGAPPLDTYAQALVDRAVAQDGELVTLAMHVTPPNSPGDNAPGNIIIASNFGRLGKPGDGDDAAVTATGKVIQEVTSGGRRLAVELPLHDAGGATLGALSTSFRLAAPDQRVAVYARAVALRDALARQIPSLERLCGPPQPPA